MALIVSAAVSWVEAPSFAGSTIPVTAAQLGLGYPVIVERKSFSLNGSPCYTREKLRGPFVCLPKNFKSSTESLKDLNQFAANPRYYLNQWIGVGPIFSEEKLGAVIFEDIKEPELVVDRADSFGEHNARVAYLRLPKRFVDSGGIQTDFNLDQLKDWCEKVGQANWKKLIETGLLDKKVFSAPLEGSYVMRSIECGGEPLTKDSRSRIVRALIDDQCTSFQAEQKMLKREIDGLDEKIRLSESRKEYFFSEIAKIESMRDSAFDDRDEVERQMWKVKYGFEVSEKINNDAELQSLFQRAWDARRPCHEQAEANPRYQELKKANIEAWQKYSELNKELDSMTGPYLDLIDRRYSKKEGISDEAIDEAEVQYKQAQAQLAEPLRLAMEASVKQNTYMKQYFGSCDAESDAIYQRAYSYKEKMIEAQPAASKYAMYLAQEDRKIESINAWIERMENIVRLEDQSIKYFEQERSKADELLSTSQGLEQTCYDQIDKLSVSLEANNLLSKSDSTKPELHQDSSSSSNEDEDEDEVSYGFGGSEDE